MVDDYDESGRVKRMSPKRKKKLIFASLVCSAFVCFTLPIVFKTDNAAAAAFEINGVSYSETYGIGYQFTLSGVTANIGAVEIKTTALLKKDGGVLAQTDTLETIKYDLVESGEYELVQYAFYDGKYYAKSYFFTVDNRPFFDFSQIKTEYRLGENIDLNVTAYIGGKAIFANVTLSDTYGKIECENSYTFLSLGKYVINAEVENNGTSYSDSKTVTVKNESYADLFRVKSGGGTVTSNYDMPAGKRNAGNGVYLDCSSGTIYSFANVVNVNELNKNTPLITWAPILNDVYKGINHFYIRMTDKYDANNAVTVDFFSHGDSSMGYIHINRGGLSLGLNDNGKPATSYNTSIAYSGTMLSRYKDTYHAQGWLSCSFSPEEKAFYVKTDNTERLKQVLDLDNADHVGVANIWNGFTTGEVYIDIEVQGYDKNGIIISEFFGTDLSGSEIIDTAAPSISVENENGELPIGFTGKKYVIPNPLGVNDFIEGAISVEDIEIQVARMSGAKIIDYTDVLENGTFTPDKAGIYRVVYFCADSKGNESLAMYTFEVLDGDVLEAFCDLPETINVGSHYILPDVKVKGLSKIVSSFVQYYYNGTLLENVAKESILIDKKGTLSVKYKFVDYIGNEVSGEKNANCIVSDAAVLNIVGVPYTAIKGQTLYLSDFEAFNYNYSKDNANFTPERTIKVNGTKLGSDLSYNVTEEVGSELTVEYSAGGSTLVKKIKVISPKYIADYFLTDAEKSGTAEGVQFRLDDDIQVQTANPMYVTDSNGFEIKFSVNDGASGCVIFKMSAFYNENKTLVMCVDLAKNVLRLNNDPTEYPITRSGNIVTILYRDSQKQIASVATIKNFLNGTQFDTMENMADFSLETSGFSSGDTLTLCSLGGMSLAQTYSNGEANEYRDNAVPTLVYESKNLISNGVLLAPATKAWKFLSGMTKVTVTVYSPDGNRLINNQPTVKDYYVAVDKFGSYSIEFKVNYGNGAVKKISLSATYLDETPITFEFSENLPTTKQVGEVLRMPEVKVLTANNVKYYFCVTDTSGKSVILGEKDVITLSRLGNYKITFVIFNDSQIETKAFVVSVREK